MVCCAVFGCKSNNNKQLKNAANKLISFYSFPKSDGLCKEWIIKCSRSDKFAAKNARICSRHFNADDFERNLKHELLNIKNAPKKLKQGAVPTANLYKSNLLINKMSNDRRKRIASRESKLIVEELLKSNEAIPAESASDLISSEFSDIPMLEGTEQETINSMDENTRLKNELENMKKELKNAIEKLKIQNELENMQKELKNEIEKLKIQNGTLQVQNQKMKAREASFNVFKNSVQKIFTPGQIRKMYDPHGKIVHWKVKDIAHAIALHAAGPRAYRWMQIHHYPLPGESTLRRWANKIDKINDKKRNKIVN